MSVCPSLSPDSLNNYVRANDLPMLKQFRYNRNDMMRNNFNYIAQSEFEQKSLNVAYNTHTYTRQQRCNK